MQSIGEVAKMTVTKRFTFEAAHRLCNPDITEQENVDLFHACHHIHGHSYKLFVTVEGLVNRKTGFVVDFKKLKSIVTEQIVNVFDHKMINEEVEYYKNNPTITITCENMLVFMWGLLNPSFREMGCTLKELKLYETEDSYATYRGETTWVMAKDGTPYNAL